MAAAGFPIGSVISRRKSDARRLAKATGAPAWDAFPGPLPEDIRLVLCCVPDDVLPDLSEALYLMPRDWSKCLVLHTSGALTTEVLAPLSALHATTLSFHPLQAFTRSSTPDAFSDIYVGLEGNEFAVAFGRFLATSLGAHAVVIPAEARARYHLAASMASNFFVTLMALAGEVLGGAGIDRPTGMAMLRPLIEGTWQNLSGHLPEDALTGPIARGDMQTVTSHLEVLACDLPHLRPLYIAMATETIRVAVRGGNLSPDDARSLLSRLHSALDPDEEAYL